MTAKLPRVFRYNSVELEDPGPEHDPVDVRNLYAATYPEIVSAGIDGPEEKDGKHVYTFRRAVGTKGAPDMATASAEQFTDEEGNHWTLPELLKDLDAGGFLYLTPKMCEDLARLLRASLPSSEAVASEEIDADAALNAHTEICSLFAENSGDYDPTPDEVDNIQDGLTLILGELVKALVPSAAPAAPVALRWLTADEITEPGNYIREGSEELCPVEMAKQKVLDLKPYYKDALCCMGSFYRPDWGPEKFYGPISLQALLKDRQSIISMTGLLATARRERDEARTGTASATAVAAPDDGEPEPDRADLLAQLDSAIRFGSPVTVTFLRRLRSALQP